MAHSSQQDGGPRMSRARKIRMAWLGLAGIVALAVALPLASYSLHWLGNDAVAQDVGTVVNPRSNYWRAVEEGVAGYTSSGSPEAGVLVAPGGVQWVALREGPIGQVLPWFFVAGLAVVAIYHLLHGSNKLDAPKPLSGRKIKRWNSLDRTVHWVTAISFILLAITGLSMLIGRELLIPLLGPAGFAAWAQLSIQAHNVIGPVFSFGVLMMIVLWIWHNFPNRVDLEWFKQGGGLIGNKHPSAGRMNAGEKVWFWVVMLFGLAVSATGLIMLVPVFGLPVPEALSWVPLIEGTRVDMQWANLIHGGLALAWTAMAIGHVYIGTAGTEGAFEGMKTGYVSEEWAVQHHDLWAADAAAKGKVLEASQIPGQVPGTDTAASGATSQQAPAR